jgi:hypothetical protein
MSDTARVPKGQMLHIERKYEAEGRGVAKME